MLYNTRAKHHHPGCGKNSPLPPRSRPEKEQLKYDSANAVSVSPIFGIVCPCLWRSLSPCMFARTLCLQNTRDPLQWNTWLRFYIKTIFPGMGIYIIKIRRSHEEYRLPRKFRVVWDLTAIGAKRPLHFSGLRYKKYTFWQHQTFCGLQISNICPQNYCIMPGYIYIRFR